MSAPAFMWGLVRRAGVRASLLALALTVAWAVATTVAAVLAKLLIDASARHDPSATMPLAAGLGLAVTGGAASGIVAAVLRIGLRERTGYAVDAGLVEFVAASPTLEQHERPDHQDRLAVLREQHGALASIPDLLVLAFAVVTLTVLNVVLLARLHPILLLLLVFALPTLAVAAVKVRQEQRRFERAAGSLRLGGELFGLATSPSALKEVRLRHLAGELIRRHARARAAADAELDRGQRVGVLLTAAGWTVFAAGYAGAVLLVVGEALRGRATAGDVLLIVLLAGQMNAYVIGGVSVLVALLQSKASIRSYLWLRRHATADVAPAAAVPIPARIESGLDLVGVHFRYPGASKAALERVNLHVPAGSTVAVVGENGSGKTTLVKLLCQLYEPSCGRILLDGIPIQEYGRTEWRSRISAGFQDFARFEVAAGQAVGVGDLERMDDACAVRTAMERAGAPDLEADLPQGLDTPLGLSFPDGVEPSLGQWQKLALGRAMMRCAPLLLLLDEPTASLDAEAEHALFERYAAAARHVGRLTGAITVLVTHRFSSTRMADLIVVMSGGRIVEAGTHRELSASGGTYAELQELESAHYR
jgi:ATP-binding cassette, subfamily B, bacterial